MRGTIAKRSARAIVLILGIALLAMTAVLAAPSTQKAEAATDCTVFIYVDSTEITSGNVGSISYTCNGVTTPVSAFITAFGNMTQFTSNAKYANGGSASAGFAGKSPTGVWRFTSDVTNGSFTFKFTYNDKTYISDSYHFTQNTSSFANVFAVFLSQSAGFSTVPYQPTNATYTYDGTQKNLLDYALNKVTSAYVTWSGTYTGTDAGTYVAQAQPKTSYAWDANGNRQAKTFFMLIEKANVNNCAISLDPSKLSVPYTGEAYSWANQDLIVPDGMKRESFTVTPLSTDLTNPGQVQLEIASTDAKNFTGTKLLTATILKPATDSDFIRVRFKRTYTFNGAAQEPALGDDFTLQFGDKTITEGVEVVGYADNTNAGKASLTLKFAGCPEVEDGARTVEFDIAPLDISALTYTVAADDLVYDGTPKTPAVTVTLGADGQDYAPLFTFTYSNNTDAGEASIQVALKDGADSGNFTGAKTEAIPFQIEKATPGAGSLQFDAEQVGALGETVGLTLRGVDAAQNPDLVITWTADSGTVTGTGAGAQYASGDRSGTASVQAELAESKNYHAATLSATIEVRFERGYYIGEEGHQTKIYGTLSEAVAAAEGTATLFAMGDAGTLAIAEPVAVTGKAITLKVAPEAAEVGAVLTRADAFAGAMIALGAGGSLTLDGVTFDGLGKTAESAMITLAADATLVVEGGGLINANSAERGGAIYAQQGATVTLNGGEFTDNVARNGGAAYLDGARVTIGGARFLSNSATQKGGAIYVRAQEGRAVAINGVEVQNNQAGELGDGIYLEGGALSLNGTDATAGLTDEIGIGSATATVAITGGITHRLTFAFDEALCAGAGETAFVTGQDSAALKEYCRVANPGYTFNPESGANSLSLMRTGDSVAYVYTGSAFTAYATFEAAIPAAAEAAGQGYVFVPITVTYSADGSAVEGVTHVHALTKTVPIDSATIQLETIVRVGKGSEYSYYLNAELQSKFGTAKTFAQLEADNAGLTSKLQQEGVLGAEASASELKATVQRAANMTAEMFRVGEGAVVTIGDVILDGGAQWEGGVITLRDEEGKAGSVENNNRGVKAHAPILVNDGTLTLDGGILQNNDNDYATPGLGFGSQNYGGAIRNEHGGQLTITAGVIQWNYCREGGAIMNVNRTDAAGGGNEGVTPTVTIHGGTIRNNVSQMKGAAVQTLYGGARTEIGGSAAITDNYSLHDLGSVTVEEGGTLDVKGGTIAAKAAGEQVNQYAVYVYDSYSDADYAGAQADAKFYIEGKRAAQLSISGTPVLGVDGQGGKVFLDKDVTVHGMAVQFAPVIDLNGYAGEGVTIDVSGLRGYSAITRASDADTLQKLTVTMSESEETGAYTLSKRFSYVSNADGGYQLNWSGYDLAFTQTQPGKITVAGTMDGAIMVKLTIDGVEYTIQGEGSGLQTVSREIDLTDKKDSQPPDGFAVSAAVTEAGTEAPIEAGGSSAQYGVIYFEAAIGKLTVPEGVFYQAKGGAFLPLTAGDLPNDVALDAAGYATFRMGEGDAEEREVLLGVRAAAVTEADGATPVLQDMQQTDGADGFTLILTGKAGFAYALFDEAGNLVADWQAPVAGKVTFRSGEGLDFSASDSARTSYSIRVRRAAQLSGGDVIRIPGEYAEDGVAFGAPTQAEVQAKAAFDEAYQAALDAGVNQYYQGGAPGGTPVRVADYYQALLAAAGTTPLATLRTQYDGAKAAYDALAARMTELPVVQAAQEALDATATVLGALEWHTTHAVILERVGAADYVADVADGEAVAAAIGDYYAELSDEGRELVAEEYANLFRGYKRISAAALSELIGQAKGVIEEQSATPISQAEYAAMEAEWRAVIEDYAARIQAARTAMEVGEHSVHAQYAVNFRSYYDWILVAYDHLLTPFFPDEVEGTPIRGAMVAALQEKLSGTLLSGMRTIDATAANAAEEVLGAALLEWLWTFAQTVACDTLDAVAKEIVEHADKSGFGEALRAALGYDATTQEYATVTAYKTSVEAWRGEIGEGYFATPGLLNEMIGELESVEAKADADAFMQAGEQDSPALQSAYEALFGTDPDAIGGSIAEAAGRESYGVPSAKQDAVAAFKVTVQIERAKQEVKSAYQAIAASLDEGDPENPTSAQAVAAKEICERYVGTGGIIAGARPMGEEMTAGDAAIFWGNVGVSELQRIAVGIALQAGVKSDDPNRAAKNAIIQRYFEGPYQLPGDAAPDTLAGRIAAITAGSVDTAQALMQLAGEVQNAVYAARDAATKEISAYDRDKFMRDHQIGAVAGQEGAFTLRGKSTDAVSLEDVDAIDAALQDLKENYTEDSQWGMEDVRSDLVAKRMAAIEREIARLVEQAKAALDAEAAGLTSQHALAELNAGKRQIDEAAAGLERGTVTPAEVEAFGTEAAAVAQRALDAAEAQLFRDAHPVTREKSVGGDKAAQYDAALEDFQTGTWSDGAKAVLDAEAVREGYADYVQFLKDSSGQSGVAGAKEEAKEALGLLVNECDGQGVRDALQRATGAIDAVTYVPQPNATDEERAQYVAGLVEQVREQQKLGEDNVAHAIAQQLANAQIGAEAQRRKDSGDYNEGRKQTLDQIVEQYRGLVDAVPSGAGDEGARAQAQQAIDDLVARALAQFAAVPTSRLVKEKENERGSTVTVVTEDEFGAGAKLNVTESANPDDKEGKLIPSAAGALSQAQAKGLVKDKRALAALDIRVEEGGTVVDPADGRYTVTIMPADATAWEGAQVVRYDPESGTIEVCDTTLIRDEAGKVVGVTFTTSRLGKFYVLGEGAINLWWLIIVLSALLALELIAILVLLLAKGRGKKGGTGDQTPETGHPNQRENSKAGAAESARTGEGAAAPHAAVSPAPDPAEGDESQGGKQYAMMGMPLLAAVYIPDKAVAICIVLGVCVALAAVGIALLLIRRKKARDAERNQEGEQ